MKKRIFITGLFLSVLLLAGCQMRTVDQMYCLPERSNDFTNLQSAIDSAMEGLEYCAPISGENQQVVQTADLDGDGKAEYLLFAKGDSDRPLRILVFRQQDEAYVHSQTVELGGTAFDRVEYAQVDGVGGMEIVVGRQLSDQVLRSVSVYSFSMGEAEQMVTANYAKFLTVDLDRNGLDEIFVIQPGASETEPGTVELYAVINGVMERSMQIGMSGPVDQLKRVLYGMMQGDIPAVYIAVAAGDNALVTDVYAIVDGTFTNVTFSSESGNSVQTLRNYYVYAEDIDSDGVVELPSLIQTQPMYTQGGSANDHLIRWYAMTADGAEVDKLFTYHNFLGGWYMDVESSLVSNITVSSQGNACTFYVHTGDEPKALMTVYALTGQSREEQSTADGRFVLHKTETVIYAAALSDCAADYGMNRDQVIRSFHLIYEAWETGEA